VLVLGGEGSPLLFLPLLLRGPPSGLEGTETKNLFCDCVVVVLLMFDLDFLCTLAQLVAALICDLISISHQPFHKALFFCPTRQPPSTE